MKRVFHWLDENLEEFDQVKEQIDKECKEAVAKGEDE